MLKVVINCLVHFCPKNGAGQAETRTFRFFFKKTYILPAGYLKCSVKYLIRRICFYSTISTYVYFYNLNLLCALVFFCIYLLINTYKYTHNYKYTYKFKISNIYKETSCFYSLFNNDTDYYWYTQKFYGTSTIYITTRKELAGKLTVVYKKCIRPYNHMSTAVITSFFCPQSVGFFNSKLESEADANRIFNCLQPQ